MDWVQAKLDALREAGLKRSAGVGVGEQWQGLVFPASPTAPEGRAQVSPMAMRLLNGVDYLYPGSITLPEDMRVLSIAAAAVVCCGLQVRTHTKAVSYTHLTLPTM
jgi:hypothetical protein